MNFLLNLGDFINQLLRDYSIGVDTLVVESIAAPNTNHFIKSSGQTELVRQDA